MNQTSGRRISLYLFSAMVIIIGGAVLVSLFRQNPRRLVPGNDKGQADANPQTDTDATPQKIVKPAPPRSDYLGSTSCAECHSKIAEQYASHSMAKSTSAIATAPPIEDFGELATFTADKQHVYNVEQSANGVKHHERRLDSQGQLLYDQSVQVEYAVGSGAHGKSYLFQREGVMFMSPITWYSKAKRWNLSPGYHLPDHRRFERRITDACLNCHVGRIESARGDDGHYSSPPFIEASIGCERCHGPGGGHVAFHRATAAAGELDPIINPAKLDAPRREDVCSQCHLQGEGRIPNYGCKIGDFRPGQRLEETSINFVKGTRTTSDGKSKAVSHVDQMRSSDCYRNSNEKLGCTSCHDPHSMPSEAEKTAHYREKCMACHQRQGCRLPEPERLKRQADNSCVACHMPPLGASDIPHTSHTDHRILRIASEIPADNPALKELPVIYDNADLRLPKLAVDRARGLWLAERSEMTNDSEMAVLALKLLAVVAEQLPDDALVLEGMGTASAVAGKLEDSIKYWRQTLAIEPTRTSTLRVTALVLQNTKRTNEAIPYFEKYLKLQPWDAAMWERYSHIHGLTNDWPKALEGMKKSEAIDPSNPRVYQWLSRIYQQLGDDQQSQHYQDLYERIKPAIAR